jgi:hypothetical protein
MKRIASISPGKRASRAAYNREAKRFLAGKRCLRCAKPATDVHHSAGRAGGLLLNSKLWIPLCRDCHNWVHLHPKAACEAGFNCPKGCWNDEKKALQAWANRSNLDA